LSKTPSIGGISRLLNDKENLTIRALLNIMLGDIILFMNVGKTMTAPQLTETVSLVVKHYKHLKPEDFKLCFEGVKKGNYGPLYDRIDGQVILSWLKAYDEERDYVAAEIASNKNEVYKMESAQLLLPDKSVVEAKKDDEVFTRNMAKLKAHLATAKIAREKEKRVTKRDVPKNQIYEMHQRWIQQFDDLFYLRPVKSKGRFIKRYGKVVDINAYLEYKQWQYQQYVNQ
jgi:hypothetical protein